MVKGIGKGDGEGRLAKRRGRSLFPVTSVKMSVGAIANHLLFPIQQGNKFGEINSRFFSPMLTFRK